MSETKKSVQSRSPTQVLIANQALACAFELDEIASPYLKPGAEPLTLRYLGELIEGGADGLRHVKILQKMLDSEAGTTVDWLPTDDGSLILTESLMTSLHLAVEAMQAADVGVALERLARANHYKGLAQAFAFRATRKMVLAKTGKAGGDATQAHNKVKRANVEAWCAQNTDKLRSVDGAAKIVERLFFTSFRTAQKWVGEWKKSNLLIAKKPTPDP